MAKRPPAPFNNPFAGQAKALEAKLVRPEAPKAPPPPPRPPPPPAEEDFFARAMSGVAALDDDPRGAARPVLPPADARHVPIRDEDTETLAELASLVDGTGEFDITDSADFIEGCAENLDRRVLRRLKAGDFAVADHLDLHGLRREPARDAVEQFIARSRAAGKRCVLIVHGKGLNSKDHIPVLKLHLQGWLSRGRIGRNILAFSTARPHDGGTGAVYVLLRR